MPQQDWDNQPESALNNSQREIEGFLPMHATFLQFPLNYGKRKGRTEGCRHKFVVQICVWIPP